MSRTTPEIREANRLSSARHRARHRQTVEGRVPTYEDDGHLPASCWCESDIVLVPVAEVRACRTGSCGRKGCEG